ncbi:hypothetical protein [Calothrix rhizosoleniae]
MLNLTYEYKLIPADGQRQTFDQWLNIYKCSECGYEANRDVAAAQVVQQFGYAVVGHIAVNFGEGKLHG